MERYKVVYEGFIFEGDSDGLNIRYAEDTQMCRGC